MESVLICGEKKGFVAIHQSHRVGRRAEGAARARIVVVGLEVVADVHRVAVCRRGIVVGVVPLCGHGFSTWQKQPGSIGRAQCHRHVGIVGAYGMVFEHHAGIVHIQHGVGIGCFQREGAVGIGVAMYRRCEKHHCGAFNGASGVVGHFSRDDMLFYHGDVIVADLSFHNLDFVVGQSRHCGYCGGAGYCGDCSADLYFHGLWYGWVRFIVTAKIRKADKSFCMQPVFYYYKYTALSFKNAWNFQSV